MKRRKFITLLGSTAVAWPLTARAQQPAMRVIGFLSSRSPSESSGVVTAFRQGLAESGFVEGQNLAIAFRWAEGHYDRLPALATELVNLNVSVLFAAGGPPSAFAAKGATATTPIVFSAVNHPVELGLVASLNRPGGNVTGMSMFTAEIAAKNVSLLKEMVPTLTVVAYLINPTNPAAKIYSDSVVAAANALGITARVVNASTEQGLDDAFASCKKFGAAGLVVIGEPFFDSQREKLVALAERYALPAIYTFREYVTAGGLMSYGPSLTDAYRRGGIYVARILKGEKSAELPVMQPTKFDFAINLKVAKTLGINVPPTLLATTDEVIE
jgi:putative tryptophan/tyrosine transport system substrate-binding protein